MTAFTAMTWNVENLFQPNPDASQEDQQLYDQKLALLANVIDRLAPDVVAFQEVGGADAIADLQQALGGTYPHHSVSNFPDHRGIRNAFISKTAFIDEEDIVDFPPGPALDIHGLDGTGGTPPINRMGRGALRVRTVKDGLTADLVTVHLKSKLLTFPRPGGSSFSTEDENERAQVAGIALMRRSAEAVTVRIRCNELLKGNAETPLLVLGDFNDVPEAQTSLIFCGPPGSELGTLGFQRPDRGDDVRLFNLAPRIKSDRRYSRIHRGRGELLDQIFASEEFLPVRQDERRQFPVSVDSHVDFKDQLASVSDNPNERIREIAPDHAPVTATFDI